MSYKISRRRTTPFPPMGIARGGRTSCRRRNLRVFHQRNVSFFFFLSNVANFSPLGWAVPLHIFALLIFGGGTSFVENSLVSFSFPSRSPPLSFFLVAASNSKGVFFFLCPSLSPWDRAFFFFHPLMYPTLVRSPAQADFLFTPIRVSFSP